MERSQKEREKTKQTDAKNYHTTWLIKGCLSSCVIKRRAPGAVPSTVQLCLNQSDFCQLTPTHDDPHTVEHLVFTQKYVGVTEKRRN